MGACIRKRVVYDMSCKRFQFFVNMEALLAPLWSPENKGQKSKIEILQQYLLFKLNDSKKIKCPFKRKACHVYSIW